MPPSESQKQLMNGFRLVRNAAVAVLVFLIISVVWPNWTWLAGLYGAMVLFALARAAWKHFTSTQPPTQS